LNKRMWIADKWEKFTTKLKRELNERTLLPYLFLGVFIYLFVSYLFAATEFYRISIKLVGQNTARSAIYSFNIPWILTVYSSELINSWFKQIVYQGIAGGITGSFVKEEIKSSIAISSSTLFFNVILVLLSGISDIVLILQFLIIGLLIGVVSGIIGIRFYKEILEELVKSDENILRQNEN